MASIAQPAFSGQPSITKQHEAGIGVVTADAGSPVRDRAPALSVVIPALNEGAGIGAILERVLAVRSALLAVGVGPLEVIVVDDGSQDATPDIVESYMRAYPDMVRLIRHSRNRGYGAALKTGFRHAQGDLLAFLDADGTYPPEAFPELCRVALDLGADLVVGSRMSGGESEMPHVRRLGNGLFALLLSL
ncbi:MAG: hypothetical protein C4310_04965, partial [Chloroflexota bacterium]